MNITRLGKYRRDAAAWEAGFIKLDLSRMDRGSNCAEISCDRWRCQEFDSQNRAIHMIVPFEIKQN